MDTSDSPTLSVVVPCRDEAAALPLVLVDVPAEWEVVVVDNGSRDGTADVARSLGARVVSEPRAGYGSAVHAGVEAARGEYVGVIDGDASMDLRDLAPMLAAARSGIDLAVGRRRPVARGVWPLHTRVGTLFLAWLIRRRSAFAIHDLAPMRVCRRDALLALGVNDRRQGYPLEMMLKAARAGWTVAERDVAYRPRAAGTTSKVSGSVRGTLRVTRDFARVWNA